MRPIHDVITEALKSTTVAAFDQRWSQHATEVIEALRREGYEIERRRGA